MASRHSWTGGKAIVGVLLAAAALAGCSQTVSILDDKDRENPLVKKAMVRKSEGDMDSAVRLYMEALDMNPKLGAAHLDLGLVMHDYKKDYVRAIYHYQRYLDLRPATEKRPMIEGRIRLAGQLFAAKERNDAIRVAELNLIQDEIAGLRKENESLKSRVRELTVQAEKGEKRKSASGDRKTILPVTITDAEPVGVPEPRGGGKSGGGTARKPGTGTR